MTVNTKYLDERQISDTKALVKKFKEFTDYKVMTVAACAREMGIPKATAMGWIHVGSLPTKHNIDKLKNFLEGK